VGAYWPILTQILVHPFLALSVYLSQRRPGPECRGGNRARDAAVRRIRILLTGMPPMLLDMLTVILTVHPDMMVSRKIEGTGGIGAPVRKDRADVVIVSESTGRVYQDYLGFLYSRPRLRP